MTHKSGIMGGLPRRDLFLLPLIMLATVFALLAGSEVAARILWPEQLVNACLTTDPAARHPYRPNCSTTMKTPEGPWYVSAYNACGYRSDAPCGPLSPGNRRIAVIGTSVAEGYLVEYPDTIAARLESDMSARCHAPIQVQNLGSLGYFGDWLLPRMDAALQLQPDSVVLVLSAFDVEQAGANQSPEGGRDHAAAPPPSLEQRVFEAIKQSRALAMAQHVLFRNPSVYLPLYLRYADKADFLRPPFTPAWQARLQALDRLAGGLAERAHRAGVPFTVAYVPQEAQVALMAAGRTIPLGIDPTALPKAIAAIATNDGVSFVDTSPALATHPTPERLYYQVDGHLSGEGLPIAAGAIADHLLRETTGPFGNCKAASSASLEAPG